MCSSLLNYICLLLVENNILLVRKTWRSHGGQQYPGLMTPKELQLGSILGREKKKKRYKLQSPGIGTLSWPAAKALHAGKTFLSVSSDPATWLDPKPSPELKAFPLPSILIGKPVRFSWLFLFFHYSLSGGVNLFKSVLSHLVNKVTTSKDKCYMWREGRPKSV